MATNREYRLERQLARRGTPEWRAAGEALRRQKEKAERDAAEALERAAARKKEAARRERIDGDPVRLAREIAKMRVRLEKAVEEARGDYPDVTEEDLVHDLWLGMRRECATAKVRREAERGIFGFELAGPGEW